ncbi:hypothetical protein [Burkholderia sp. MBR-1]|uniref:hypothetical protein n=1 Tax=Burkholderia sp. MBR-1 TaxID=2732364 RepID=UPI0015EE9ED3|nr:hypothetical protein [Burkholderia sp. MBR-1]QMI49820.1 hypothetical protein MBR110_30595 [Burkholderia sp. MBR-1]
MNQQPKLPSIFEIEAAMNKVSAAEGSPEPSKRVWWADAALQNVLIAGAAAGYLHKQSHTQVHWTESGAQALKAARTAMVESGKLPESPSPVAAFEAKVALALEAAGGLKVVFSSMLEAQSEHNAVYHAHSGQTAEIIGAGIDPEKEPNWDEEALPFLKVRFADGVEVTAFGEELFSHDARFFTLYSAVLGGYAAARESEKFVGPYHLETEGTEADKQAYMNALEKAVTPVIQCFQASWTPQEFRVGNAGKLSQPTVEMKRSDGTTFPDRVRFNWGFHDGTSEAERAKVRDMEGHQDRSYAHGYVRGVLAWKNLGYRPESSDEAWSMYQGHPPVSTEAGEVLRTHRMLVLQVPIRTENTATVADIAASVQTLIQIGIADAHSTLEDKEGDLDGARLAADLEIGEVRPMIMPDAMPKISQGSCPRVLVTVSGGVADFLADAGVDVVVFDHDNYSEDPEGSPRVPAHFGDLGADARIPPAAIEKGGRESETEGKLPVNELLFSVADLLEKRWEKAGSPGCAVELVLGDVENVRRGNKLDGVRSVRSVLDEATSLLEAWIADGKPASKKESETLEQARAYLSAAVEQTGKLLEATVVYQPDADHMPDDLQSSDVYLSLAEGKNCHPDVPSDAWLTLKLGDIESATILDAEGAVSGKLPGCAPTKVRKTIIQFTVLHDDGQDLSSMSLRDIAYECDEGGYIGGGLALVSHEALTRLQVDAEAAKLGSDASFFDSDPEEDSQSDSSSSGK